jgi:hypothetical protein
MGDQPEFIKIPLSRARDIMEALDSIVYEDSVVAYIGEDKYTAIVDAAETMREFGCY